IEQGDADPMLWKQCDRAFHHALIMACGSTTLMATHSAVYDKYLRYQMVAVIFRGAAAAQEHGQLLDCALHRDAARANEILRRHIESCVDYALSEGASNWLGSAAGAGPVSSVSTPRSGGSRVASNKRR
ncbi:MAG: FCD domain-containing protein, partial [Oxalobacteraceae bacterium]